MGKDNQPPNAPWRPERSSKKSDNADGDAPVWPWMNVSVAAVIPQVATLTMRAFLGITVALYILNQKHALPRPLGALVSKALFWPTLPITVSRRVGKWMTRIDDTVVLGGAPFGFLHYPEQLYEKYGVRGVINLCEEYQGPLRQYKELGIEHLYLPTTDHFEPSVDDLISAVSFIRRHEAHGKSVYVHCRAGHGRSAAAVFAWLLYKDPIVDVETLNADFCKLRNVRRTLWKQPNLRQLHARLIQKGTLLGMEDEPGDPPPPKLIDDDWSIDSEDL